MNIFILNWRDIKNPRAGGAELLTQEMAKRWVLLGHNVTIFCERFESAVGEEIVDGVKLIRRGRWWSVHLWAVIYYFFRFRSYTDVIVDEAHWYPFFSIIYAPKKTVLLVCEVANRLFFRLFPLPIAFLGRIFEKLYFYLYRKASVMAISLSTIDALVAEGIPMKNITVVPMGLSTPIKPKRFSKESKLTLIIVGRLHLLKGTNDAIDAFVLVWHRVPSSKLWIVGGDSHGYRHELERRADRLGVADRVNFFGHVSEEKKFELLSRAHLLLVPSAQEGWGLVVAEAASQGTPSVGYRTDGLKDVILDGLTGVLVELGRSDMMADEVLKLWKDQARYHHYQELGKRRAATMNWDNTAKVALSVLRQTYEKQ